MLRAGAYALRHLGNDGSDLFRRLDMDGDGRITFPEFAYVMLQGEDDDDLVGPITIAVDVLDTPDPA